MVVKRFFARNVLNFAVSASVGFVCASCAGDKPPADAATDFRNPAIHSGTAAGNSMPAVPKDAQFTIVCKVYQQPTHQQDSEQVKQMLADNTNMKKWYVVHAADHSTLYYGFYRCNNPRDVEDGEEGKRAINDLNAVRQMQTSNGVQLFGESLLVGVDVPDPEANPAWDIAQTKGTWSIEIASYVNTPERKKAAVDSVREMRAHGVEAYYYHGETASSVCIGCWPAEAAVEVSADIQNDDPNRNIVVTNQPLTELFMQPLRASGIKNVAPHVDVQDLTLDQELRKWPEHAVNGDTHKLIDPNTGAVTQVDKPFIFKIPHDRQNNASIDAQGEQSATPVPVAPSRDEGLGHLRSLEGP